MSSIKNMSRRKLAALSLMLVSFALIIDWLFWLVLPLSITTIALDISSLMILAIVMGVRIRVHMPIDPELSTRELAYKLRLKSHVVKEIKGKVRLDLDNDIWLILRPEKGMVIFRTEPTSTLWAIIIILLLPIFPFVGIAALPIIIFLFVKANLFVENLAKEISMEGPSRSPCGGIRENLIGGLSDGYRIASETLEVERSEYDLLIIVLFFPVIIAAICSLFVSIALLGGPGFVNGLIASAFSIIIGIGLMLVLVRLLGKSNRKRISEMKDWSVRFQNALRKERDEASQDNGCSLELLMQATRHIPEWLDIKNKATFSQHPIIWTTIMTMGLTSLWLASLILHIEEIWTRSVVLIGTIILLGLIVGLYHWMTKKDRIETEATVAEWNARFASTLDRMEKIIEDL
ncbi:MAG: hypothetical protein ABR986_05070 [Methanomassiliicoccales archaeon]